MFKKLFCIFILFFSVFQIAEGKEDSRIVKIAVRAHSGAEKALKKWRPTADYLTSKIQNHRFEIVPVVSTEKMLTIVALGEVDFVLTNPAHFVELAANSGVTPIATLKNLRQGRPYIKFGGVIFCRADRQDISSLSDLQGKTFMAVAKHAFGGWWMDLFEFRKNGINPFVDFKEVRFGGIQERVVFAVRDREVDAGSVRTDMLERMASSGEINLEEFRVLNLKKVKNFPFLLSTELYPEWPFLKTKNVSLSLARLVSMELYKLPSGSKAAIAGNYYGWTVPVDYSSVHNLMKDLRVGPYTHYGEFHFHLWDFIRLHMYEFIIIILLIVAMIFATTYISRLNRKLNSELLERKKAERELENLNIELAEKNKGLEEVIYVTTHDLRTPLINAHGFTKELTQTLRDFNSIINSEEDFPTIKLKLAPLLEKEFPVMLEYIHTSTSKMDKLISGLLRVLRLGKASIEFAELEINELIRDIEKTLKYQIEQVGAKLEIAELPQCLGDMNLINQVFSNLIGNSLKYLDPKRSGIIKITGQIKESMAIFCVEDNGMGISSDNQKKIFKMFHRVSPKSSKGEGLGLSIISKIVAIHGGKVWVESEPDKGSKFYVSLPKVVKQDVN